MKKNENKHGGKELLGEALDVYLQGAGKVSSALLGMVNKVGGQIYALLFLTEEPLSLDEISEKLCVSKGNISINVRMLEDFNLVRKVWVKGSRKDYYSAERIYPKKVITDFLEKIQGTMKDAIMTIERTKAKTAEARLALSGEDREKAEFILEQLKLMGLFYYAANQFFEDFFQGKHVDIELLRRVLLNPEDINRKS